MNNKIPQFNNISKEKMMLINKIMKESENISSENLIPFFMNATTNAKQQGISFTNKETNEIINSLKKNMTPAEINKLDNIIRLAKIINKQND